MGVIVFEPVKMFQCSTIQKNKTKKTNCKESFVELKNISKNRGICKHLQQEVICEKLFFKMLRSTLRD